MLTKQLEEEEEEPQNVLQFACYLGFWPRFGVCLVQTEMSFSSLVTLAFGQGLVFVKSRQRCPAVRLLPWPSAKVWCLYSSDRDVLKFACYLGLRPRFGVCIVQTEMSFTSLATLAFGQGLVLV